MQQLIIDLSNIRGKYLYVETRLYENLIVYLEMIADIF